MLVAEILNASGQWVASLLLCTLSDKDIQLALALNHSIIVDGRVIIEHIEL